jgi:hypothetical protein
LSAMPRLYVNWYIQQMPQNHQARDRPECPVHSLEKSISAARQRAFLRPPLAGNKHYQLDQIAAHTG